MTDETAKRLLDGLLDDARIGKEKFYHLVGVLRRVEYIDPISVRMAHHHSYVPFTLMATYTGPEQIGRARIGHRHVNSDVREAVARIYSDISSRSGIQFSRIRPSLDDEYCAGFADVCLDKDSYLMVVLANPGVTAENL